MEAEMRWELVDLEVSKGDFDLWGLGQKERVCFVGENIAYRRRVR